jgi:hypothetical protein
VIGVDSVPVGCDQPATALDTTPMSITMHCGLIPGSSGGPLLARTGNEFVLVGIVSTGPAPEAPDDHGAPMVDARNSAMA